MSKSITQVIGSFVFRNEGDGCLTSKYHHRGSVDGPFTEACKRLTPFDKKDQFIGVYRTIWLEDSNKHVAGELTINRHAINNSLFKLIWSIKTTTTITLFEGSGMLFGDLLVGSYWN